MSWFYEDFKVRTTLILPVVHLTKDFNISIEIYRDKEQFQNVLQVVERDRKNVPNTGSDRKKCSYKNSAYIFYYVAFLIDSFHCCYIFICNKTSFIHELVL